MSPRAMMIVNRDLKRLYPELPASERATRVAEFVDRGWVTVHGDSAVYADPIRAAFPKMPAASDYASNAAAVRSQQMLTAARDTIRGNDDTSKLKRARLSAEIAASRGTMTSATAISEDMAADLAAVPGSDDRSKAKRALIREAHARANMKKRNEGQ